MPPIWGPHQLLPSDGAVQEKPGVGAVWGTRRGTREGGTETCRHFIDPGHLLPGLHNYGEEEKEETLF